jgi:hypothetical protein
MKDLLATVGVRVERMSPEERRLRRGFDPLHAPPDSEWPYLTAENPRLLELEAAYALDSSPMGAKSLWTSAVVADDVDLRYFRGDNLFLWQYTRSPVVNRLRNFVYGRYIQSIDHRHLLDILEEDGAFGCYTFVYDEMPRLSRDLLDSVAELSFLDRHTDLFKRDGFRMIDIGAGYGRLAHRALAAAPGMAEYVCIDAVPRSTFLCEYYLGFRGLSDRATVLELPDVAQGNNVHQPDLAVNIHSFSEMPLAAVDAWVEWLSSLAVSALLIVSNERTDLLSREADGSRSDCAGVLERHGYTLEVVEPLITDAAVRDVLAADNHFLLYRSR